MSGQQKNIHYFPGHMKKALSSLDSLAKVADVLIEVLDARAPKSTENPLLSERFRSKPTLIALSKRDLADERITKEWVAHFEKEGKAVFAGDLKKEKAMPLLIEASAPLIKKKREKEKAIGMKPQPIRLLVVGVPNVGKSTLINNLAGKTVARAENRPGVTRAEQWIKLSSSFILLDTPGILPMNYPDGAMAVRLALLGSIKEEVLPIDYLALALLGYLKENYPKCLNERYGIEDLSKTGSDEALNTIAVKRGFLLKAGEPDLSKAASALIKEFHDGYLGRISLEAPDA